MAAEAAPDWRLPDCQTNICDTGFYSTVILTLFILLCMACLWLPGPLHKFLRAPHDVLCKSINIQHFFFWFLPDFSCESNFANNFGGHGSAGLLVCLPAPPRNMTLLPLILAETLTIVGGSEILSQQRSRRAFFHNGTRASLLWMT